MIQLTWGNVAVSEVKVTIWIPSALDIGEAEHLWWEVNDKPKLSHCGQRRENSFLKQNLSSETHWAVNPYVD